MNFMTYFIGPYTGRYPSIIKSLDCCASMNPDNCKMCAYNYLDKRKCMATLLEEAKEAIIREEYFEKQLEEELHQARCGTNYGK